MNELSTSDQETINYIDCIAFVDFVNWDKHKVRIIREENGKLIGKCCHGDEFIIDDHQPLYREVR